MGFEGGHRHSLPRFHVFHIAVTLLGVQLSSGLGKAKSESSWLDHVPRDVDVPPTQSLAELGSKAAILSLRMKEGTMSTRRKVGPSARRGRKNRPSVRLQRFNSTLPLVWFNVPRSAPAFAHILLFHACPEWPAEALVDVVGDQALPSFFKKNPISGHCPARTFVPDTATYSLGGHAGIGSIFWEAHKGHFIGMFRHPSTRAVDAWMHSEGSMSKLDAESFARTTAGCLVKTLTNPGKHPCSNHTSVSQQQTEDAVSRIQGFAYVGIVELWSLSVCLWHAMFGGKIGPQAFVGVPAENLDDSQLNGWLDEADTQVYAAALRRFFADLDKYHVRDASCQDVLNLAF